MKKIRPLNKITSILVSLLIIAGVSATVANAVITPISLGNASNFAVIAGGGISNTGQSFVQGDLGLTPVISYLDNGLLTLKGNYHFGDTQALGAQTDASSAYAVAANQTPTATVVPELAGTTLIPGIYSSASGLSVNGILNFDAQKNPNALFILQTPAALSTGANSRIILLNGAQACNVYWQVGTTSTLGAVSDFKGNILGKGNFVSSAGTLVQGRVLTLQGSVNLNSTQILRPQCAILKVESGGHLVQSAGSYPSPYGNATYNIKVEGRSIGSDSYAVTSGKFLWSVSRSWKFSGNITTYTFANGSGTMTGNGQLLYYGTAPKGKEGRWINISGAHENFTIKFTRVINPIGTVGDINAISVGFTGNPIPGAPQLPILGTLIPVKSMGYKD